MKQTTIAVLICGMVLSCGCATTRQTPHSTTGMVQKTYEVFGMDCPGCHGGLEKNLLKIPGVVAAKANWKRKTVTITSKKETLVEASEIGKAIQNSNFTVGKEVK